MSVFIDTSAFFAILDADDINHKKGKIIWQHLISEGLTLICSNYILVESFALIQQRLGTEAVRVFQDDIVPLIGIEWIDEAVHMAGVSAALVADKRNLSLVDCISFIVMRRLGIKDVFGFDRHFAEAGFNCIDASLC